MSSPDGSIEYRRFRAPQADGERMLDPPWDAWPALVRGARSQPTALPDGWPDRATARSELLTLATQYTLAYRDVRSPPSTDAIVMSGHQPRLFHPGVWLKNFLLDRVARVTGATAINLVVDNDLGGSASIRVPAGSVAEPRQETVAYDESTAEIPWEERGIRDDSTLHSFGERALSAMAPFPFTPLLRSWWPQVLERARAERNLGRCIASARHRLEADWGVETLEVPLSQVCNTRSFRQFLGQLLDDAECFARHYNEQLATYRRIHKIRSRSHPVPALERTDDGWQELPLWVWTRDDSRRRRLFVQSGSTAWRLADRHRGEWSIPRGGASGSSSAVDALSACAARGVRIRPRALLTTMYSRLVLSDLFLHGIGGGKYDQLTDAIARAWIGAAPPRFVVATATTRLPIPHRVTTEDAVRAVDRALRRIQYNPDKLLEDRDDLRALLEERARWIAESPAAGRGAERHAAIGRLNARLRETLAPLEQQLETRRAQLLEALRAERVLSSREYAFCLFPESALRNLLLDNR